MHRFKTLRPSTRDSLMSAIEHLCNILDRPPQFRELAEYTGKSVGTLGEQVDALRAAGLVRREAIMPTNTELPATRRASDKAEKALSILDNATRWADAFEAIDLVREVVRILKVGDRAEVAQ